MLAMLGVAKYTAAAVLAAAACLCLGACGAAKKDAVVVTVGKSTITQATVDHWIRVEAVTSRGPNPTRSAPKGSIPVPPGYADCIAYLRAQARSTPKPSSQALEHACAVEYGQLKQQILELLITYYWISGEGARQGLAVTDAEVGQYLQREYPTHAQLQRFLEVTGETPAEQRMLAKRVLMSIKLQRHLAASTHTSLEQAIPKFATDLAANWAGRTSCRPGYVVPQCKQYRGPHT